MRVIVYLLIENTLIFIANVIYMNRITKEVYHNLERFASFKGLSNDFIEFTIKPMNCCDIDTYFQFMIPFVNLIALIISVKDYDKMVSTIQNEVCNNFLTWVDEKANNNN